MSRGTMRRWYIETLDNYTYKILAGLLKENNSDIEKVSCHSFPNPRDKNDLVTAWEVNLRLLICMRDGMRNVRYRAWALDNKQFSHCPFFDPPDDKPVFKNERWRHSR